MGSNDSRFIVQHAQGPSFACGCFARRGGLNASFALRSWPILPALTALLLGDSQHFAKVHIFYTIKNKNTSLNWTDDAT